MNKAQVGISSVGTHLPTIGNCFGIRRDFNRMLDILQVWYTGNPCNMHLMDLNNKIKEGVENAGLIGYQFNTVGVR